MENLSNQGVHAFRNRLEKNFKNLKSWLRRDGIQCYRLYDADIPEYAVAVDVYECSKRYVHIQEYQAPYGIDKIKSEARLVQAVQTVQDFLQVAQDRVYLKIRLQQKGKNQYTKLASRQIFHTVVEGGLQFLVNFSDYLDTGLFLDHRITRRLVFDLAKGKRFLNLFAYTGSASVYAADGGASTTTTVDMSKTYLEWAKKNMQLNGYVSTQHDFVHADCLDWLEKAATGAKYDLIFLDPPSFSTSKRMTKTFDIQRDHVLLLRKTTQLLNHRGILIFSNNLRTFKLDHDALTGLIVKNITKQTIPKDFSRNSKIHQCFKLYNDTR